MAASSVSPPPGKRRGDATAGIEDHHRLETLRHGIPRRGRDAEIRGQAAQEDAPHAQGAQVAGEPRAGLPVVLGEAAVAVHLPPHPLAEDRLQGARFQRRMQGRAGRALHAMIRPQRLRAIGEIQHPERRAPGMLAGEGEMARRMPVLRRHHPAEARHQRVGQRQDLVPARDGERAARHEVGLHVHHDQDIGFRVRRERRRGHADSFPRVAPAV
jgi:hypothetical protein